jgi:hypothetical protein
MSLMLRLLSLSLYDIEYMRFYPLIVKLKNLGESKRIADIVHS